MGKNRLIQNICSLGLLQGANYLLPFLTFPYLVRVLGPDNFGLIAFATALITYAALLSDYGFNLSATRQISIHRENHKKISKIYSTVMVIKLTLMMLSLISVVVLVTLVDRFNENWEVYIISFGLVVGQVLFPIWLFQGLEIMKYITYINLVSRAIFTSLIFLFVHQESDYLLVPILSSLGALLSGIWAQRIILGVMKYEFLWPSIDDIKKQLGEGWHFFISSIAISFYTTSTVFIIGLLNGNTIAGQYAAAEKIIQAFKGLFEPIGQALFPYSSKKMKLDVLSAQQYINQVAFIIGMVMGVVSFGVYYFSEELVIILLGEQYIDCTLMVKIMSPLPFVIAISNIYALQGLYNLGLSSAVSKFLVRISSIHILLILVVVNSYAAIGAASMVVLTETIITLFSIYFFRKVCNKNM